MRDIPVCVPILSGQGPGDPPPTVRGLEGLTRLDILTAFPGDFGHELTPLPWWGGALAALDAPEVRAVLLNLKRGDGKTTFACGVAAGEVLLHPGSYVILIAGAESQAQAIYQRKLRRPLEKLLAAMGLDRRRMRITRRGLELLDFGSVVEVLATSEVSAPGRSPSLLIFDESRDIGDEIFEVLSASAIGGDGKILALTSAGRPRGWFYALMSNPAPDTWVYRSEETHNPRASRGVVNFLERAFQFLSPSAKAREVDNKWAEDEARPLATGLWEQCVEPTWSPMWATQEPEVFIGLDAATKADTCAAVAVARDDTTGQVILADHRIWTPRPGEPVDLEATVEATCRQWARDYRVREVRYDPFQLARSAATLAAEGLPMKEFAQTEAHTARMAGALFDALTRKTLVLYEARDLREQAGNVVLKDTARGMRLAKRSASAKIDGIVALALACVAAIECPVRPPLRLL